MSGARAALVALALLTAVPALAAPRVWGYVAWWMRDEWQRQPLAEFERLAFFELKVDARGAIVERHDWPEAWRPLAAAVRAAGGALDLTLTLAEPAAFERVFAAPAARDRLLAEALALAADEAVDGIQLDFEIYERRLASATALAGFNDFVRGLADALEALSRPRALTVFLPVGGDVALYEPASLARARGVVAQAYDAHWPESRNAGPVAPLDGPEAVTWQKALAATDALGVPRARVYLSFPLYGYEWPVKKAEARAATRGRGSELTFAPLPEHRLPDLRLNVRERVAAHGLRHDPVAASSSYLYQAASGQWVAGWFEDWWSLERKTEWLVAAGAGGLAFFPLGYDDGQLLAPWLARRAAGAWGRTPLPPAAPPPPAVPPPGAEPAPAPAAPPAGSGTPAPETLPPAES